MIGISAVGGLAGTSSKIENYLGFPEAISGAGVAERAREQVCRFGAEILISREGVRCELVPGNGIGYLADGTKIVARAKGKSSKRARLSFASAALTQWAADLSIVRDEGGYLVTGPDLLQSGKPPASWPLARDPFDLSNVLARLWTGQML